MSPQEILQAKQLQAHHQQNYHPTSYQDLAPQDRQLFIQEMSSSPWGRAFMSEHGVSPQAFTQMIQTDPSYSYVDAWKRGLIPEAGQHWRDRADDGTWLKSPSHPAAWMEYYQGATGYWRPVCLA
jgi:hypothetical protein